MVETDNVRVSVCMVTYNQEKYIAQAIESVLMQKTDFKFRLIIGDDASTDGTTEIIKQYAKKYPDIVKPIFHEKNVGAANNSICLYNCARTEYVAICDGDDYWIDEYKLQKQIDFLDKHRNCSICFTKVKVFYEDNPNYEEIVPDNKILRKRYLTAVDLLGYNFITTVSVVWRWKFISGLPEWYNEHLTPGDLCMSLIHARDGKIGFLDEVTSVYRRHKKGVWYITVSNYGDVYKKYGLDMLEMIKVIRKYYDGRYLKATDFYVKNIFNSLLDEALASNDFSYYAEVVKKYRELYNSVFNRVDIKLSRNFRQKFINFVALCLFLPKPYK